MAYFGMSLLLCGRPVRPVTTLTDEQGPDRQSRHTNGAASLIPRVRHDHRTEAPPRSGGEGHPGVGVAAVAEGVLREVLLVRVLGVVVRRLAGRADLGGDLAEPTALELLAVDGGQLVGDLLLLRGREVDRR